MTKRKKPQMNRLYVRLAKEMNKPNLPFICSVLMLLACFIIRHTSWQSTNMVAYLVLFSGHAIYTRHRKLQVKWRWKKVA